MEENLPETAESVSSLKRSNLTSDTEKSPSNKKLRLGISVEKIRKQFKTDSKAAALQQFLLIIEDDSKNIVKYLQKGGSPLEILQTLEGEAGASPVLVFDIVNRVLLEIGSSLPHFQNLAYDSCRYLLNTFLSLINKMLNLSSSMTERVSILKLLTTIATFSGVLAKDILLNVNFNPTNIELLTKIGEKNHARACFIHFITAFLVDGHFASLSVLLEKKGLMTSIVNGLLYDPANIVILVLTAMKNHILENLSVSKTLKMRTFNTKVIKDIVNLYNWKGPAGLEAAKRKKIIDESDKNQVNQVVHSFLLMLCTSHKYGVVFKDPHVGLTQNSNGLILTVLESLTRPWEHSYAGELVLKICKFCPDLVKRTWMNLRQFLQPRWTAKWLKTVDFAKRLLDEIQPENIEFAVNNLSDHQIFQVVVNLTSPIQIFQVFHLDVNNQPSMRFQILSVYLKMIERIEMFLKRARSWSTLDFSKFSVNVAHHINQYFPTVAAILTNWLVADENLNVSDYLNVAFDLLEKYKLLSANILNDFDFNFNISEFLSELDAISDRELLVKILNFFLDFDTSLFTLKTNLFQKSLTLSLEHYYAARDTKSLGFLHKLLQNTNLFDGFEFEIDFWINGILVFKNYENKIAQFLFELFKKCDANLSEFQQILFKAKNSNFSVMIFALENLELSRICKKYLSFVILNIFHCQNDTEVFLENVQNLELPENLTDYMRNWSQGEATVLKKLKGNLFDQFGNFSESFLRNELVVSDDLYPNQKLDFFQMAIFYLTNLSKNLEANHKKNCLSFLEFLINEKVFADSRYVKVVLGNGSLLQNFQISDSDFFMEFLIIFIKKIDRCLTEPFLDQLRFKLFSGVLKLGELEKYHCFISMETLETIALDYKQCRTIIENLIDKKNNREFYQILSYCLSRILILNQTYEFEPLNCDTISKLAIILNDLVKSQTPNLHLFTISFHNYLKVHPHSAQNLNLEIFQNLLSLGEFNKYNLEFCEFLFDRIPACRAHFLENLEAISAKKSFLLALLDVALKHFKDDSILERIFQNLETHILKAIHKPHKAGQHFQNNYKSVGILVGKFLKLENYANQIHKFETTQFFHVYLLKIIFEKLEKSGKVLENMILTFVHLLKQNGEDLGEFGELFWEFLSQNKHPLDLSRNETLKSFTKMCLKFGVSGEEICLKILIELLDSFNAEESQFIFEMMFAHSQFLDHALGGKNRVAIFQLWLKLVRKVPQIMDRTQVPILLAAYRGTNGEKYLLDLLKLYEEHRTQTKFYDFKPFLWGRAAASHYSVRTDVKVLWRQPKTADVLNCLNQETIISTILNPADESSYDLDFFLPLFSHILAPENPITTYKFTRSGALALALVGLRGSKSQRFAACYILQRFHFHLEARQTGKDNPLWLRFIEAICKGISRLEDFKINNFVGVFLSWTALILTQPTESMFVPISQYLAAKDNLDFSTIPELYTFLHSSHVDSKKHKLFILKVIRDSLKNERDFHIFLKSMSFKLISSLISSTICDQETQLLIVEIYEKAIDLGVVILNEKLSFLSLIFSLIFGNLQNEKLLARLLDVVLKISRVDQNRQRNFAIYLNMMNLVSRNCEVFKCNLENLFEILMVVTARFPDFFKQRDLALIIGKSKDGFCAYMHKYGCEFVAIEDFLSVNRNLRLLVYNKLSRL